MTSSHHAPYVQGFTHATMAGTESGEPVRVSESRKAGLSSDWGLQLDLMKSESLVIADQQRCGEYVPGACTHRPSRANSFKPAGLVPLVRVNSELGVIMVIAVSCVKLLSAHNSTQHTSRKHKV